MKGYLKIILVLFLSAGIVFSCKKSSPSKDTAASIKNKTWWGEMTYAGQTKEYYSIQFNADNSLVWSQLSGDYSGNWVLDGKKLTLSFTGNSVKITADISDDDKLVNITDNTTFYDINSGQLIADPNIAIVNTTWMGSYSYLGTTSALQINFLPSFSAKLILGAALTMNTYTRSTSGAVIRMNTFFGVITSANEMKGSYNISAAQWHATKQ